MKMMTPTLMLKMKMMTPTLKLIVKMRRRRMMIGKKQALIKDQT